MHEWVGATVLVSMWSLPDWDELRERLVVATKVVICVNHSRLGIVHRKGFVVVGEALRGSSWYSA